MKVLMALSENGCSKKGPISGAEAVLKCLGVNASSTVLGSAHCSEMPRIQSWKNSVDYLERLASSVSELSKQGQKLLVLSGDHSAAIGILGGLKRSYPDSSVGVIWIDAHADAHSPFTTHSGNLHGMPVSAILKRDCDVVGTCEKSTECVQVWTDLLEIGNPKDSKCHYKPENFLLLGLRSYESEEMDFFVETNVSFLTPSQIEIDEIGTIEKVKKHISSHDLIFVSFDVDSIDSSFFKSTGLPSKNGLKPSFIKKVLEEVKNSPKWIGLELTEVSPNKNTFANDIEVLKYCLEPIVAQTYCSSESKTETDLDSKFNLVKQELPQVWS